MKRNILAIILIAVMGLSGCISISTTPCSTCSTPVSTTASKPITVMATPEVVTSPPVSVPTPVSTPTPTVIYQQPSSCSTCPYGSDWYDYQQWKQGGSSTVQSPTYIYTPAPTPAPTYVYVPSPAPTPTPTPIVIPTPVPAPPIPVPIPVTPTPVTPAMTQLGNGYNVTDVGNPDSNHWRTQTFLGRAGAISQVTIIMEKIGNPGDLVCEIRGIASYRASASSIGGKGSYAFPMSASLTTSQYAIVLHAVSGDRKNYYRIYGTNGNSYDGGCVEVSPDGGRTWRSYPTLDMAFSVN